MSLDIAALTRALEPVLGERVTDSAAARDHHGRDEAWHRAAPDLVAYPASTEEVAEVVRACARFRCPVTPWGAGTSLEGGCLAANGGLSLDLSRMDRVLQVAAEDLTVTVEAGVRRLALEAALKGTGLFFPVDPGADATLGGMASTRASGTTSVRYGTMRHNVLACTVVTAEGRVVRTGVRAPKNAAGYDLTALMVGAEGTLGVITELVLRLHPLPEAVRTLVCAFDEVESAVDTVIAAVQCGLSAARLELLDAPMMRAINRFQGAHHAETPTLFAEFHGPAAALNGQASQFAELVADAGGRVCGEAVRPEERSALWKARHDALYASRAQAAGRAVMITDVCVPISALARCLRETREDLARSALPATIAGHVGDGNFHVFIGLDPDRPAELAEAQALHARMARRAIALDGTCTGEHGVGLGKRELLAEQAGGALDLMRRVKQALDPQGIMNPGKLFV